MSTLVQTSAQRLVSPARGREVRSTAASLRKLHERLVGGPQTPTRQASRSVAASVRSLTVRVAEQVERDLDDPDSTLFLLSERMLATERAYGFGDDNNAIWRLEDAPAEYRLLDMEWNAEVRRITSRVLAELVGDIAASNE